MDTTSKLLWRDYYAVLDLHDRALTFRIWLHLRRLHRTVLSNYRPNFLNRTTFVHVRFDTSGAAWREEVVRERTGMGAIQTVD